MHEGEVMKIVAIYRVEDEPSVWYHLLETTDLDDIISSHSKAMGLGANVTRTEYKAFRDHNAAQQVHMQIPCNGWFRTTKSTQELLKLKRIENV